MGEAHRGKAYVLPLWGFQRGLPLGKLDFVIQSRCLHCMVVAEKQLKKRRKKNERKPDNTKTYKDDKCEI